MKFAATIEYTSDKATIARVRPEHRQYLKTLLQIGRLAVCGPFPDDSGGLIVYEADSAEHAEKLIHDDPFFKNGVFQDYRLRPWNPVMGNLELFAHPR